MQDYARWLLPSLRTYTDTEVKFHVSAGAYYETLAKLIGAAGKGDVLFFGDWEVEIHQTLGPNASSGPKLWEALKDAIGRGVKVRALFDFDQNALLPGDLPFRAAKNQEGVKAIRERGGEAMLDTQQRRFGSFHQKLLFVTVGGVAHAFCGGIDIARRWPWLDVQCQLTGAAAGEVLATLQQRWDSLHGNATSPPAIAERTTGSFPPNVRHFVQLGRTYGKADERTKRMNRRYAERGEYSFHALLARAIPLARRFVFVQDQYLFAGDMKSLSSIPDLLAKQLTSTPRLVVVIIIPRTDQIQEEVHQGWYRRLQAIQRMSRGVSDAKNRIRIYQYKNQFTRGVVKNFVHAKVWLFDDEFAIVGSANFNRRGLSNDGEAVVAVSSPALAVRDLRIDMWLEHLNNKAPGVPGGFSRSSVSEFSSGLAQLESSRSPLERYDPNGDVDYFGRTPMPSDDGQWNLFLDPDGS